ncbi:MAG TPA: hypothetical protein VIV83_07485 [Gemmatimonadales bacterium]|jgi:hypothetical protein
MNREALRLAWQYQNITERQYQEHAARCAIKSPACAECVELRAYAQGMYVALDQVNPAHECHYDTEKLFWGLPPD